VAAREANDHEVEGSQRKVLRLRNCFAFREAVPALRMTLA